MKLRIARITLLSVLTIAALLVAGAAGAIWRLSQGPVSISFMREGIVTALNQRLGGIQAELGDAILEVDQESKIPSIRFVNVVLKDHDGQTLASAPKAAVSLDLARLLKAEILPRSLDLIGPRVLARRNIDGSFELGFDNSLPSSDAPIELEAMDEASASLSTDGGKSDLEGGASVQPAPQQASPNLSSLMKGRALFDLLAQKDDSNSLSALTDVRISRANLVVFDEANDARWNAPRTDFAFRKMPYGFIVAAKSDIASGGEPWRLEFTASYTRDDRRFNINAAIGHLVPANLSDEIFALSDFAKVTVPLSGNVQMQLSEDGQILGAEGQLVAAAGKVSFPEYLARTFVVDEGTLQLAYNAESGSLDIINSTLLVGGSQIGLSGQLQPNTDETGRVRDIGIKLAAKDAKIDAQGTLKSAVKLDRISFDGRASVDKRALEVRNLSISSGSSGLEMSGTMTGGGRSVGMNLNGTVTNMSDDLLKAIWPPPVAPKSREWIAQNIIEGQISDGTFTLNFAPDGLARALQDKQMDRGSLSADFNLRNVDSKYFKELPILQNGAGRVVLRDDSIRLDITSGFAALPSGEKVVVRNGSFMVDDMLVTPSTGIFKFNLDGSVSALLEARTLPDLKLNTEKIAGLTNVDGKATVTLDLSMPLIKNPPPAQIKLNTVVGLTNVAVQNPIPGINLTKGDLSVAFSRDQTRIEGDALLNGIPSKIMWNRNRGESADINIRTVFDEKTQASMGLKFSEYLRGPIPVDVRISGAGAGQAIAVDADLSSVSMKLAAMGWSREKTPGTKASFVIRNTDDGRLIDDLVVNGPGLQLAGNLQLSKSNRLQVVDMRRISLDGGETSFAARIAPRENGMDINVSGQSLDATPYIKQMLTPAKGAEGGDDGQSNVPVGNFRVTAKFNRVYAYRGEVIENVSANLVTRGKIISQATINGNFLSGQPISIQLDPVEGGRELRVNSSDGGATLRATNFYSKIAGGEMDFYALMSNSQGSPIRNGRLSMRSFAVRNEAALAELDSRGRPKKSGPRQGGINFKKLDMPFTTDAKFVRLGDTMLRGVEVGATAQGIIRKSDGAMDITGTYIPAYALNAALGKIPLFGDILTGGNREGIFGVTYAVGGTMKKPKFQINPLSAVAPGIFRKLFEFQPPRRVKPSAVADEGPSGQDDLPY